LAKGKTGAQDGVQATYDRGPGTQGLSRSTSLRAETDEKTNSALGLARRESADQETRKLSSIKNERKCDFAFWLPGKKSSLRRRQNLAVGLMETGAQELT
jgi:hypothetical protein